MTKIDKNAVSTATIISTPRGDFRVGFDSVDEAKANGFGLHFEHDGYAILVKDNIAIAAPIVSTSTRKSVTALEKAMTLADAQSSTPTDPLAAPATTKATNPTKPAKTPANGKQTPATAKSGKVETSLAPAARAKAVKQLESITADIRKETGNIASAYMRIGFNLWQVKNDKLYLAVAVDGKILKNVYEYCETAFGFQRSSAANFIAICEKFSTKDAKGQPTANIDPTFAMFGYTQLSVMLPMDKDTLGLATPEMSKREIKALNSVQPVGQPDDTDEPTEKKRTVAYSGEVNEKTYDSILAKLEKLMGSRIQIIVEK